MALVSTLLTRIGYRLGGGITISSSSDPSQAACIAWLNETALWMTGILAEHNSDLGKTIGTITTINADITAATAANPCAITAASHGLMTSGTAEVLVRGVLGMTELNDTEYTATYVSGDSVTLGISSAAYTAYTSGGYITKRKYSDLASYMYAPAQEGWIVNAHDRSEVKLRSEDCLLEYDPVEATEPDEFYVDGANNICFPSYPDDVYTVKIPYWQIPTALTATTDTFPFLGLLDNVAIEAVVMRAQNRDEYDLEFEQQWNSFLLDRVIKVIEMRKNMRSSVGL